MEINYLWNATEILNNIETTILQVIKYFTFAVYSTRIFFNEVSTFRNKQQRKYATVINKARERLHKLLRNPKDLEKSGN